jgi:septal ring factor EnvC (AmiA/AmiB activator)
MVSTKSLVRGSVLVIALAMVLTFTARASSQSPSSTEDALRALVTELHALRLAMEQQATVSPRIQLSMARLNIEEQRMSQINQQLDQVRRQLTDAITDSQNIANRIQEVERNLADEKDEKKRAEVADFLSEFKQHRQPAALLLEQQLRARELELSRNHDIEQARWIELNSRLDELERVLAPTKP